MKTPTNIQELPPPHYAFI